MSLGKIKQVAADLGSVNQVIDVDAEIQEHLTWSQGQALPQAATAARSSAGSLAGGQDGLDRTLTDLSRTYDEQKTRMHLTPANARRVVDTALHADRAAAAGTTSATTGPTRRSSRYRRSALPGISRCAALTPGSSPASYGDVTFDDRAAAGREDLVHIHLGHALLQRSARTLRSALFSVDSPVHRVTAVVADGLPQSCVAAVSRLVLVGRGGLRLHEEVFLTGIRIRGQAMAEEKVEAVLDKTLDAEDLMLADEAVRRALAELWNQDGSPLRTRLLTAMTRKATARQETVTDALYKRRDTDIDRAAQIYAAFRVNLRESRERLAREIREQDELLFPDDQQRQRRHDLDSMDDTLLKLDGEERREIAAIRARYEDIKPHVTAAAIVFALTPRTQRKARIQP